MSPSPLLPEQLWQQAPLPCTRQSAIWYDITSSRSRRCSNDWLNSNSVWTSILRILPGRRPVMVPPSNADHLDVVAEQHVHIAQVEPPVGNDGEHARGFFLRRTRRIKRPPDLKAGRARLDQRHLAGHASEIQSAIGVGQGTWSEADVAHGRHLP